jgi:Cd2+/Zn2+-exporting ATPase
MFFVWWLAFGYEPFTSGKAEESAFYHAMTLLVVASPCALVLSIPSAVLAAIAWGARHGILFRGGAAVEKLAAVDTVALDKTGTLTTGELRVEKVESFPPGRERDIAGLAFSLERLSTHPLARAITKYGTSQGLKPFPLDGFQSVTGQGLRARFEGSTWFWVVVSGWRNRVRMGRADRSSRAGRGWSFRDLGGPRRCGRRMLLRDDVRAQSRKVVEELRAEGLGSVVLTGDHRAAADHLKRELRLDDDGPN